jgi:hypothetical protein
MKLLAWTCVTIMMAVPVTLTSQEDRLGKLKFNGFVSVVGGRTFDDNSTYIANAGANLAGSTYDDSVSFSPDTTFAIQARVDLGEGLSATAQLLGHAANDFDVEFEWAYVQYDLTEEVSFYGGRKRVPFYLYSDTLDLGYGYHWIRPPFEMYWISVTNYDGVSASYATMLGPLDSHFEVFYGEAESTDSRSTAAAGIDIDLELDNLGGAFWTVGYEWLQARLGMSRARVEIIAQTPLALGGPTTMSEGNDVDYYAGALKVENQKFFIIGEYGETRLEKTYNDAKAWYVSAGVRIGKFTPHATFSEFHELATRISAEERATTTVGLRYDFHDNAALKVEYSKVQDRGDSPATSYYGDAELISIGVDMSF